MKLTQVSQADETLNIGNKSTWRIGLLFAALLLFMLSQALNYQDTKQIEARDQLLTQEIIQQGELATLKISQEFNQIKQATADIETALTQNKLTNKEIRQLIANTVNTTHGAFRGGVVFKKNRFDPSLPLYSPFYQKGADNKLLQQLSDNYDYTIEDDPLSKRPRTFWFHQPLKEGAMWLPPYYGTSAKSWIAEYIRPFHSNYDGLSQNGFDGIIFLNLSLSGLSKIVSQLDLAQSGYGFILTSDNTLISYPDQSLLGKNINQIKSQNSLFNNILTQKNKGQISVFTHPINKKECWLFFSPIAGTQDTLGILVWADELRATQGLSQASLPLDKIASLLCLIALILILSCLFFPNNLIRLGYRFSILISLIMFISLINLWADQLNGKQSFFSENQVFEAVNVNNLLLKNPYLTEESLLSKAHIKESKNHEISLNIKNLSMLAPGVIQVIGTLSIDHLSDLPDTPPLFFPLANATEWEKLESTKQTQSWKFIADIKQPFNYASFPFDMEEVKIQIKGKGPLANKVITPNFHSYPSMAPKDLPGLSPNKIEVKGWKTEQSYFSYEIFEQEKKSLLSFNILIKRNITGPIITHLLPLIMVSCLAFCTLLLWSKTEKKMSLWGFSSATVLEQCAALFFILVISHVSLRDELEAKGMIFLEYFYFGTYAQIVFVAIAAIIYTSNISVHILDYREGLIIKMLYWPFYFLFCISITLINFL